MPRISSLAARAAATPPIPEGPTPEQPGAALPALTGKLHQYAVARPLNVEPPGGKVNYVVTYHPMAKKALAISNALPGVKEGDVVVIRADDHILPVSKLHLVAATQYWTTISYGDGEVLEVAREKPANPSHLEEHIESLVLCYTPEGVVSAKATWRKTRTPFAKAMAAALRENEGRWQDITGTPVTEQRTNKTTGKPYTVVTARVNPINNEEARALANWLASAESRTEFEKVVAAYEERGRYLDGKVC